MFRNNWIRSFTYRQEQKDAGDLELVDLISVLQDQGKGTTAVQPISDRPGARVVKRDFGDSENLHVQGHEVLVHVAQGS